MFTMTEKTPVRIEWRLHTVMSDRGIRTAAELWRRLQPYGITLTSHQVARVVANAPARLNTELLVAICSVLQCSPNDILRVIDAPHPGADR